MSYNSQPSRAGSGRGGHGKENPRRLYAASPTAQPALVVRGSSRRINTLRFRPAYIRLINRRDYCFDHYPLGLARAPDEKTKKPNPRDIDRSFHIRDVACHVSLRRTLTMCLKMPGNQARRSSVQPKNSRSLKRETWHATPLRYFFHTFVRLEHRLSGGCSCAADNRPTQFAENVLQMGQVHQDISFTHVAHNTDANNFACQLVARPGNHGPVAFVQTTHNIGAVQFFRRLHDYNRIGTSALRSKGSQS